MISNTCKTIGAAVTVVAALAVVAVPMASADSGKNRDAIRVAGSCTVDSTSKLKVKRDNRRLKVEFEVDQNTPGVVWQVKLTNDADVVFEGERTTSDRSGSFGVERRIKGATSGTIAATASNGTETCSATLAIPVKPGVPVGTPVNNDPTKVVHEPNHVNNPPNGQADDDDSGRQGGNTVNGNSGHSGDDD